MREAENFRGHVVQFRGLMETSERFPIPENKSGVTDAWLAGGRWEVEVACRRWPARVQLRPWYDPGNQRIKA